jgi:hypothetical protein
MLILVFHDGTLPSSGLDFNDIVTSFLSTTVGLLMVPTEDLAQYTQDLQSRGFVIDSTHNFPDLRDGDEQTLVVWEVPESRDISTIIADLAAVSQRNTSSSLRHCRYYYSNSCYIMCNLSAHNGW